MWRCHLMITVVCKDEHFDAVRRLYLPFVPVVDQTLSFGAGSPPRDDRFLKMTLTMVDWDVEGEYFVLGLQMRVSDNSLAEQEKLLWQQAGWQLASDLEAHVESRAES